MPARILIVEDESLVAEDLQSRLDRLGYDVVGIRDNAVDALQAAVELTPDLVLLDIRLKGPTDGVEVAHRLREQRCGFVFLTAHADRDTLARTSATEPFGYIVKPFDERGLQATIVTALNRHRADRQLRHLQQQMATTLHSIGDAVIATDRRGRIDYVNPAAAQLLDTDACSAIGRVFREVVPLERGLERAAEPCPIDRVLASGASVWLLDDVSLRRQDGSLLPIEDCAAPILDEDGRVLGVVIVFRDASIRRRLLTEQRQLTKHLHDAERLRGLAVLAGGLAHDFNNILASILGNAQYAGLPDAPEAERAQSLAAIRSAVMTAAELCRNMMDTAGVGNLDLRPLDLPAVAGQIAQVLAGTLGRNVELQIVPRPGMPKPLADRRQIGQVLTNLILNAAEAIGDRPGCIRVTMGQEHCAKDALAATIGSPDLPAGNHAFLEVADDGPGMPADVAARVFEPFFTTKLTGRGLGLAGALGIVRRHAGAIAMTTAPGVGSSFRILLPLAEPRAGAATRTIVVIDDEPEIRLMLDRWLTTQGYRCVIADGVRSGMATCLDNADTLAGVVLDYNLPDGKGSDVLARLRQQWPELPIILISGLLTSPMEGWPPHVAFLAKPFPLETLASLLARMMPTPPSTPA